MGTTPHTPTELGNPDDPFAWRSGELHSDWTSEGKDSCSPKVLVPVPEVVIWTKKRVVSLRRSNATGKIGGESYTDETVVCVFVETNMLFRWVSSWKHTAGTSFFRFLRGIILTNGCPRIREGNTKWLDSISIPLINLNFRFSYVNQP